MSNDDYTGIVICGETVSIDIMLPEQSIVAPDGIKQRMEEELGVKAGNIFTPFKCARRVNSIDSSEQGRPSQKNVGCDTAVPFEHRPPVRQVGGGSSDNLRVIRVRAAGNTAYAARLWVHGR